MPNAFPLPASSISYTLVRLLRLVAPQTRAPHSTTDCLRVLCIRDTIPLYSLNADGWQRLSESVDPKSVAWDVAGTTTGQMGRPLNTAHGSGGVRHSHKCSAALPSRLSRSPLAPLRFSRPVSSSAPKNEEGLAGASRNNSTRQLGKYG